MKTALLFPGQGSQFVGMGKYLIDNYPRTTSLFQEANELLGFDITTVMQTGSKEELQQTKVTQNAIFIYSIAALQLIESKSNPLGTAGHSLGEFTSLVASKVLSFKDALSLVNIRALAMQKACEANPSTMSAVLGAEDEIIQTICESIKEEIVTPANYNCQGQVVISGSLKGIEIASEQLKKAGAKRVIPLPVGGAFHSPLMQSAKEKLQHAILSTHFNIPDFPIYQNVVAQSVVDPEDIKTNLIAQLTGPVMWTQSIQKMVKDGYDNFIEVGPGKVLQGLVKKINNDANVEAWKILLD